MARELSVEVCAICAADPENGYRSPHRWVPIGPATDMSDELDLTEKDPT